MPHASAYHFEDLAVDQLDPLIPTENPDLGHAVVFLDVERPVFD